MFEFELGKGPSLGMLESISCTAGIGVKKLSKCLSENMSALSIDMGSNSSGNIIEGIALNRTESS